MNETDGPTKIDTNFGQNAMVLETQLLKEELENLWEIEACEIFCYQLSYDIVDHSLAVVQDRYYDEKCIPFTVNSVAEQMFTILDVCCSKIRI
jgi:hypothetical protein